MKITTKNNELDYTFIIEGRVDTLTAGELESATEEYIDDGKKIIFDMSGVDYVSSAGIRVIIQVHQNVGKENFVLKNVPANVMELFRMTGFQKVLNFE